MSAKEKPVLPSKTLQKLMPKSQLAVVIENPEAYSGEMERLNDIVEKIPKLYETDNKKGKHPLNLHYFMGSSDWYITEWDGDDTFFGYAILKNDLEMSEWGYISLSEILGLDRMPSNVINFDFHCYDETVELALFRRDPKYFQKYDPYYEANKKGGANVHKK
jgi:hypothetical protein